MNGISLAPDWTAIEPWLIGDPACEAAHHTPAEWHLYGRCPGCKTPTNKLACTECMVRITSKGRIRCSICNHVAKPADFLNSVIPL